MLVLTRKAGQSIVISGRITLRVNRIAGNRVALAFDAPPHVLIRRGELAAFYDDALDEQPKPPLLIEEIDSVIE